MQTAEQARSESKRIWRIRRYKELVRELESLTGSVCSECGIMVDLVFDHPHGRDYDPAKLDRVSRLKRYLADWVNGNLRRLCRSCNTKLAHCEPW